MYIPDPNGEKKIIEQDGKLYFTIDGVKQTNGNEVQTGETLYLYETTPLRVRAFKDGYLPSTVVTQTFIENDKDFTLPILSIATDNANLYDDYMGCYVRGTNTRNCGQWSYKSCFCNV